MLRFQRKIVSSSNCGLVDGFAWKWEHAAAEMKQTVEDFRLITWIFFVIFPPSQSYNFLIATDTCTEKRTGKLRKRGCTGEKYPPPPDCWQVPEVSVFYSHPNWMFKKLSATVLRGLREHLSIGVTVIAIVITLIRSKNYNGMPRKIWWCSPVWDYSMGENTSSISRESGFNSNWVLSLSLLQPSQQCVICTDSWRGNFNDSLDKLCHSIPLVVYKCNRKMHFLVHSSFIFELSKHNWI